MLLGVFACTTCCSCFDRTNVHSSEQLGTFVDKPIRKLLLFIQPKTEYFDQIGEVVEQRSSLGLHELAEKFHELLNDALFRFRLLKPPVESFILRQSCSVSVDWLRISVVIIKERLNPISRRWIIYNRQRQFEQERRIFVILFVFCETSCPPHQRLFWNRYSWRSLKTVLFDS